MAKTASEINDIIDELYCEIEKGKFSTKEIARIESNIKDVVGCLADIFGEKSNKEGFHYYYYAYYDTAKKKVDFNKIKLKFVKSFANYDQFQSLNGSMCNFSGYKSTKEEALEWRVNVANETIDNSNKELAALNNYMQNLGKKDKKEYLKRKELKQIYKRRIKMQEAVDNIGDF
jgi:hypothetical protein